MYEKVTNLRYLSVEKRIFIKKIDKRLVYDEICDIVCALVWDLVSEEITYSINMKQF